jgi:hypothetical protein
MKGRIQTSSSLPLQVLIYYHYYLIVAYTIISICTFIYKSAVLPYPSSLIGWEVCVMVFLIIVDVSRLSLGEGGNKTRQVWPLGTFLLLSVPVAIGCAFLFAWQTYVLRIDAIIYIITLVFTCLEGLIGTLTFFSFLQAPVLE